MGEPRTAPCPICNTSSTMQSFTSPEPGNQYLFDFVECPRCSKYKISDNGKVAIDVAFGMVEKDRKHHRKSNLPSACNNLTDFCVTVAHKGIEESRSIVSHVLHKTEYTTPLFPGHIFNILKNYSLPTPAELADNLILYLGQHQPSPGQPSLLASLINSEWKILNICGAIGTSIKNGNNSFNL